MDAGQDTGKTKNFNEVWATFKAAGWPSKPPPRCIGTLWKYVLPGHEANGAEGVDYFLGEQAVVNYAIRLARKRIVERIRATKEAMAAYAASIAPSSDTSYLPAVKLAKAPVSKKSESSACKSPASKAPACKSPASKSKTSVRPRAAPSRVSPTAAPTARLSPTHEPPSASKTTQAMAATTSHRDGQRHATSSGMTRKLIRRTQLARRGNLAVRASVIDICGNADDDVNTDRGGNEDYVVIDSGDEPDETDLSEMDVSDFESSLSDSVDEDDEELYANEERHFTDQFLDSMGGERRFLLEK
ncbi:hypothetical protein PHYPSEUDO_011101 [Phytophthora pseudosyringae]|uniref:Uncharacterized protein n=1 Tax=Phytophthora pseudosyringae TaxID=221518 RepID=A0A8T1WAP8_9STRA|nr:hypothetical protein PHYPSEUDO_011101 [Phytophthora pseudosyringae]